MVFSITDDLKDIELAYENLVREGGTRRGTPRNTPRETSQMPSNYCVTL